MDQIQHIQNNKAHLDLRFQILRLVREFFWLQDFIEVETPLLLKLPGQEPYLSPMKVSLHNEKGEAFQGFLHTSPEYTMKKMLASGYEKIFSLCKVFRDYESFGGTHNPEFTMVEWYRANEEFTSLMDDVEQLFQYIGEKIGQKEKMKFERVHMRDLWKEYIGVNLDEYLEREKMFELCHERGFAPAQNEAFEDLFYRIFLNEIEPKLALRGGVILHHYPGSMAALSRISKTDPLYAERFEVYIDGLEIANAFGELTDRGEQRKRLLEERELRTKLGKDVYDIDEEFVEAVGKMPESSGIALGIDRLVQHFTACQNIDSVIALPASKLF
jgi:lysyl-tRNA synthetase class 2